MKTNRRIIREKVLQVLYAFEINGEGLTYLTDGILSDVQNQSDVIFAKELINKVVANKNLFDEEIRKRVENWEMDRIALIDKILLMMGMAEISFFPDIPPKVSINEVIEIAKEYSTSNSGKFINGILDSLLSDLKKQGKLKKAGRGLVDETLPKKVDNE
ncbi:MAG: transcription antitermination factor NusB [Ignavibacteriales bacterium]|jgi:N utilization substance protein B|nr:transcription antitermination factor NusB [Ignavibacteriales bacterium]